MRVLLLNKGGSTAGHLRALLSFATEGSSLVTGAGCTVATVAGTRGEAGATACVVETGDGEGRGISVLLVQTGVS